MNGMAELLLLLKFLEKIWLTHVDAYNIIIQCVRFGNALSYAELACINVGEALFPDKVL